MLLIDAYTIEFLSNEWITNILISASFIIFFLIIGKCLSHKYNLLIVKLLCFVLFLITIFHFFYLLFLDIWNIKEHLPLHLCSINGIISIFILLIRSNKDLFEFNFYGGVIGGAVAIITPQLNDYDGSLTQYIIYFISHGLIIIIPLYLYYYLNFKLRRLSWLRSVIYLTIIGLIFIPLNSFLKSNYMYVNSPPKVNNLLIIGEWPIYLVNLEIIIILLFFITYCVFTKVSFFTPSK